jgi:hypothetical protein
MIGNDLIRVRRGYAVAELSHTRAGRCLHAEQATSKEDTMALRIPKAELPAELRASMICWPDRDRWRPDRGEPRGGGREDHPGLSDPKSAES